jgi:hypothetical protein
MFLTVSNATCKAISTPVKTASIFQKDLDLMTNRHTTDICELLSEYWGIEHDKVKLELGSSVQEWNAKLESQVQSVVSIQCYISTELNYHKLIHAIHGDVITCVHGYIYIYQNQTPPNSNPMPKALDDNFAKLT